MGVSAAQVGSYFVEQYYQYLPQQPNLIHKFYSDKSTMIRVDGDSTETASDVTQIDELVKSLNFVTIEVKTLNSLDSLDGAVLVMVSGFVKIRDVSKRRKFVQTFFLAPQEKGYFVLNDIFHFIDDGVSNPDPVSLASEKIDTQPTSTSLAEPPASDYDDWEEQAKGYVDSVHIEDDWERHLQQDLETAIVVKKTPAEEASPTVPSAAHIIREPPAALADEPLEEPPKKTWASILRVSKGQPGSSAASLPSYRSAPNPSVQQSSSASTYDESYWLEGGGVTSVYVRNLPSTVTEAEIEQEFENFGRIKPGGILVRVKPEIGVCYAFVEFEDTHGAQNSIQASPIHLAGRQVYIEERKSSSGIAARGGRGRGRSNYVTDSPRGRFGGRSLGRSNNSGW